MAHAGEMCTLGVNAAKDLERHRRTHEFAESVRERLHLVPLTFARAARRLSDEEEQERRNRQRHQEEQGGEGIGKHRHNENQRDQHHARNHRGQYRVKERIKRIDPFERECQGTGGIAIGVEH